MNLTLGFTGMDEQTESRLRAMFRSLAPEVTRAWRLLPHDEARYVVVDMDTMYGPMSWLSLANAGKQVIALTQAERTSADFLLRQPLTENRLQALLEAIACDDATPAAPAANASMADDAPPPEFAVEAHDATPEARLQPSADDVAQVVATAGPTPPGTTAEAATTEKEALAATAAPGVTPARAQPAVPFEHAASSEHVEDAVLDDPVDPVDPAVPADPDDAGTAPGAIAAPAIATDQPWYNPQARQGRWLLSSDAGPALLLDFDNGVYHGPATLKPLQPLFTAFPQEAPLQPMDASDWDAHPESSGEAQPLQRLHWYGALLAGDGALLQGMDPAGQFRLGKWPRTEREFPRHFRIATTMMRAPATIAEIAAASEVPEREVIDFINAHNVTGHAQAVVHAPPAEAPAVRSGSLLSRLRGRGS
ncbi:MAG: hypothetical protein Q4F49_00025 [Pseudoxanthomonas suwonensis]|nr:hypothetical protein [Pseudoxanthomonas suwonensis]